MAVFDEWTFRMNEMLLISERNNFRSVTCNRTLRGQSAIIDLSRWPLSIDNSRSEYKKTNGFSSFFSPPFQQKLAIFSFIIHECVQRIHNFNSLSLRSIFAIISLMCSSACELCTIYTNRQYCSIEQTNWLVDLFSVLHCQRLRSGISFYYSTQNTWIPQHLTVARNKLTLSARHIWTL